MILIGGKDVRGEILSQLQCRRLSAEEGWLGGAGVQMENMIRGQNLHNCVHVELLLPSAQELPCGVKWCVFWCLYGFEVLLPLGASLDSAVGAC